MKNAEHIRKVFHTSFAPVRCSGADRLGSILNRNPRELMFWAKRIEENDISLEENGELCDDDNRFLTYLMACSEMAIAAFKIYGIVPPETGRLSTIAESEELQRVLSSSL